MSVLPCEKIYPSLDLEPLPKDFQQFGEARVLLIEDDRTTRAMVKSALEKHCCFVEAPNMSQGITLYNYMLPDIVFLDIELPDGDGNDLLHWMLRNDPGAYVVMFSGYSHTSNVIESMNTGAKGFVSKPFDIRRMLYFIDRCPRVH